MSVGSRRAWEWWLAVLAGVVLGGFGAGGVAQAAEQVAAEAPLPTELIGGGYVASPFIGAGPFGPEQRAGQSISSTIVPTVSGRLSRVDIFVENYNNIVSAVPLAQNLFVDLTLVDAEGRPSDVLGSASVPVSSLPPPNRPTPTAVVFGDGPRVVASERYALVYRADGCCVLEEETTATASVPGGWAGPIPFGSTTTNWLTQGPPAALRMWVDTAPANLLDVLIPPRPAPRQATAPREPAAAPPLCGRPVTLTDVALHGREVRLAGVARSDYAGRAVTITADGRIVARTTVAPDDTFRVTATRTKRSAKLRYQAHVADARSAALKANRLLIIDSQTSSARGLRVRGHLISRRRAHRTLTVVRRLGCSPTRTTKAKTVRTDRRGRFSVTLPTPPAGQRFAVYRLRTTSGGKTYSLPLVLRTP